MATWDYFTDLIETIESQKTITFLLLGLQQTDQDEFSVEAHCYHEDLGMKIMLVEVMEEMLDKLCKEIEGEIDAEENAAKKEWKIEKKKKIEDSLDTLEEDEKRVMLNKLLRDQKERRKKKIDIDESKKNK